MLTDVFWLPIGWVDTVKTGHYKELPPQSQDWYVSMPTKQRSLMMKVEINLVH